jgi:hypothetical protein
VKIDTAGRPWLLHAGNCANIINRGFRRFNLCNYFVSSRGNEMQARLRRTCTVHRLHEGALARTDIALNKVNSRALAIIGSILNFVELLTLCILPARGQAQHKLPPEATAVPSLYPLTPLFLW